MNLFNATVRTLLPLVPKAVVAYVARRYVAGETLAEVVETVRKLNSEGACATMDILGEEVFSEEVAESAVQQYLALIREVRESGIDSTISVKPTMLGLRISEELCRSNIERLFEEAGRHSVSVAIDMEDHTTTDATLRIFVEMAGRFAGAGCVLQACLQRTLADIDSLPEGANVRLVKGIYIEPKEIAYQSFRGVRENFLAALDKLITCGMYAGIATHDEYLVQESLKLIAKQGLSLEEYEFQVLLGVKPALRQSLVDNGHTVRVYVPYGPDWYAYSIRRLHENPAMAKHVLKALFVRG
ncbi:proline dehydrogenase family protein [bacterium]|nr:proline dehydrogenase family protein [bacterium]